MTDAHLPAPRPHAPPRRDGITCIGFTLRRSGSLVGFADLHLPKARLKFFACPVHESHGKRWVNLPAKPLLDRERRLVTDDAGKVKYVPFASWDSDDVRWAFSIAAVAAIEAYDPTAFADGGAP